MKHDRSLLYRRGVKGRAVVPVICCDYSAHGGALQYANLGHGDAQSFQPTKRRNAGSMLWRAAEDPRYVACRSRRRGGRRRGTRVGRGISTMSGSRGQAPPFGALLVCWNAAGSELPTTMATAWQWRRRSRRHGGPEARGAPGSVAAICGWAARPLRRLRAVAYKPAGSDQESSRNSSLLLEVG